MSQHTPGPWRAIGPNLGQTANMDNRIMVLHPDGERLICQCDIGYAIRHEITPSSELEANATLIAAAPELLEALRQFAVLFSWLGGEHPKFDAINNAQAMARKAIAKAEGRTPLRSPASTPRRPARSSATTCPRPEPSAEPGRAQRRPRRRGRTGRRAAGRRKA